jgi:subtilisin family serine protease
MACPHVVGVAGLIKSHFPEYSNEQIRSRILGTSDDICVENPYHIGKLGQEG